LTTPSGRSFAVEVIVVSDGSTDGTTEAVDDLCAHLDLNIRSLSQKNAGPAAARNRGIEAATGTLVLFIDDDVVPDPGCVAAHVERHDRQSDLVVVGPMLTPTDAELSPWVAWEQHQLEKQYAWFANDPTADHIHFYTGNASVERTALLAAGGFDTTFTRAEDIELAYRLGQDGQSFVVELAAGAHHYAERSFDSWITMAYAYGQNSVRFATMGRDDFWDRIRDNFLKLNPLLRGFALALFPHRRLSRLVTETMARSAILAHRLGLSAVSRGLLSGVYAISNVQGVADEMGAPAAFVRLVRRREVPIQSFVALFVLEQTLGHVTHSKNLRSLIPTHGEVTPVFLPIDATNNVPSWIPGASNWTVRAGLSARRAVRRAWATAVGQQADAMFVHTQVPAVMLGRWMRRIPTVVSIDATPKQYDSLGEFYAHRVGPRFVESVKRWANVRCFQRAEHVVAWSNWAKEGLVEEYGIEPSRITVIPPGVDLERWAWPGNDAQRHGPLRVLFVGGDLRRKGGDQLIEAARRLRADADVPDFELHLVTGSDVPAEPGIDVHNDLTSNSPELVEQYHLADIFCLPTLGDCLPMVLAEAAAAGLPLISTDVGAIGEIVVDGRTGRLVQPGDLDGLVTALRSMLTCEDERRRLGAAARDLAMAEHDARTNAGRILDVLKSCAATRTHARG
jgi:glycosyltransferase involved in cell wall biosynthesis/GT2 family glycosyltransferase